MLQESTPLKHVHHVRKVLFLVMLFTSTFSRIPKGFFSSCWWLPLPFWISGGFKREERGVETDLHRGAQWSATIRAAGGLLRTDFSWKFLTVCAEYPTFEKLFSSVFSFPLSPEAHQNPSNPFHTLELKTHHSQYFQNSTKHNSRRVFFRKTFFQACSSFSFFPVFSCQKPGRGSSQNKDLFEKGAAA